MQFSLFNISNKHLISHHSLIVLNSPLRETSFLYGGYKESFIPPSCYADTKSLFFSFLDKPNQTEGFVVQGSLRNKTLLSKLTAVNDVRAL